MNRTVMLLFALAPFALKAEPLGDLVDYIVENGEAIPAPLAPWAGGPAPGAAHYEAKGCAACHDGPDAPDLKDIAARLTAGEIRLAIVDSRILYPETVMPAYYAPGVFGEAPEELVGRTRLTALEIEQLVAYLTEGGP